MQAMRERLIFVALISSYMAAASLDSDLSSIITPVCGFQGKSSTVQLM